MCCVCLLLQYGLLLREKNVLTVRERRSCVKTATVQLPRIDRYLMSSKKATRYGDRRRPSLNEKFVIFGSKRLKNAQKCRPTAQAKTKRQNSEMFDGDDGVQAHSVGMKAVETLPNSQKNSLKM